MSLKDNKMNYDVIGDELFATCPHCGCVLRNKKTGEPFNLLKLVEDDIKISEPDVIETLILPRSSLEVKLGLFTKKGE